MHVLKLIQAQKRSFKENLMMITNREMEEKKMKYWYRP